jgi:hypothetical protein
LFDALDGRHLVGGDSHARIEVFSIRDEADRRWLQLAVVTAADTRMVTLRLLPGQGPQHVVTTLTAWLANPTDVDEILHVA